MMFAAEAACQKYATIIDATFAAIDAYLEAAADACCAPITISSAAITHVAA